MKYALNLSLMGGDSRIFIYLLIRYGDPCLFEVFHREIRDKFL